MPQAIVMPKLGNTVESAIILAWHVAVGETVSVGELLCEIETDKATLEVESSASGVLLGRFYEVGDEVPVLRNIAVVGDAGERYEQFHPATEVPVETASTRPTTAENQEGTEGTVFVSPRARNLAVRKDIEIAGIKGSGPDGRIIERDIQAAIAHQIKFTPVAKAMVASGDYEIAADSEPGSRVSKRDLVRHEATAEGTVTAIPLVGIRKTIAKRMLDSTQNTAQLTMNASADARALLSLRARLKKSDESLGLRDLTINDLLMFAVARTLKAFPQLNATFDDEIIYQHQAVHLGMAVDTAKGLLAPVIRNADALSARELAATARRMADACRDGKILPDELTGGTFTVTNLGGFGIESFTPILNPPQVAILGVGNINPKPVQAEDSVAFVPHIGMSLTVNHQIVDGAPAARFLAQLRRNIADIELLLAT